VQKVGPITIFGSDFFQTTNWSSLMNHYKQLTHAERYMIYTCRKNGISRSAIARMMNRPTSTISRELHRNSGGRGYRHKQAHNKTVFRRQYSHKKAKITAGTLEIVGSLLHQDWSPEQVSNYLRLEYETAISTERIYQHIWSDKQCGGNLYTHLRQHRKKRRKRYGTGYDYRGHIKNRTCIDDRPKVVEDRERIGDWEIDTIIGKRHKGALVSIVERKSRYVLVGKVKNRESSLVQAKTTQLLFPFRDYVFTITGDNGKEFASHEDISVDLGTTFYFAHPYSSWERGLNENTNGLIRQYVPKGSDLSMCDDKKVLEIMNRLNTRPRKCLGWRTPQDVFISGIGFSSPLGEKKDYSSVNRQCTNHVALTS